MNLIPEIEYGSAQRGSLCGDAGVPAQSGRRSTNASMFEAKGSNGMLRRQKIALALLDTIGQPVSRTVFVKLMFLLRQETELRDDSAFYDFLPYRFGPFSFALYREMEALRHLSYVSTNSEKICLNCAAFDDIRTGIAQLSNGALSAVSLIATRYGRMRRHFLIRDVYSRYPWFATKTELTDHLPATLPQPQSAAPAVYTIGYEGQSVDGFFDRILRYGIHEIADVRANPVSRKYGFARSSLSAIAEKLELGYRHFPQLGIPSAERIGLGRSISHQDLFEWYESTVLARETTAVQELGRDVRAKPTALLCMEGDAMFCHRSRLADAVSASSGLPVTHLS